MHSLALVACVIALSHCALAAKGKHLPLSNSQYYPEARMREAAESNRILKPSDNCGQVFWRGIFSESYFLFFSLPFLPLCLPMVRWTAVYKSIKWRKTEKILTEVAATRLPACRGHCVGQKLTSLHPSAQLPAHLAFPSAAGAAWHGSCLAFLLLSPTPRALGTVSCTLSLCLLCLSTAQALCSSVLSSQSQQEPLSVSFAPSIPPLLLPSCSHSLGDELFVLSTC